MASTSISAPETTRSTTSRTPRSASAPKLTCLCSPTNHPGSFRCSRHRERNNPPSPSDREAGRHGGRAAAKGRSVRALLLQRIASPSDRDRPRRRRGDFQPRPSRLRLMNK